MTADAGLFSPEDARTILQVVRQVQQSGILSPAYADRIVRRLPRNIGGMPQSLETDLALPINDIPAMTTESGVFDGNFYWARFGVGTAYRVVFEMTTGGILRGWTSLITYQVYNASRTVIPAYTVLPIKKIRGLWFANHCCSPSTGGPNPVDPVNSEPDDSGTTPPGSDPEPPIDIGV